MCVREPAGAATAFEARTRKIAAASNLAGPVLSACPAEMADAAGHHPPPGPSRAPEQAPAPADRRSRKRAAPGGENAAENVPPVIETVLEALASGREPRALAGDAEITLHRAAASSLDGIKAGDGESSAFIFTDREHLTHFLPKRVTREGKYNLLVSWAFLKLLPPDWYAVVFQLKDEPRKYRAVSESKRCLDGYPQASKSPSDPETAAGFANMESLRLVLFPNALRFFWYGLDEPLRVDGAWPTTREVQQHGYTLRPDVYSSLVEKLGKIPPDALAVWRKELPAALERRFRPVAAAAHGMPTATASATAPSAPVPAYGLEWPLPNDTERRATAEARALAATLAEERAAQAARIAAEATAAAAAAAAEAETARALLTAGVRCVVCGDVGEGRPCFSVKPFKCEPTVVICAYCEEDATGVELPFCANHGWDPHRAMVDVTLCCSASPFLPAKCSGGCMLFPCDPAGDPDGRVWAIHVTPTGECGPSDGVTRARCEPFTCSDCVSVHRCGNNCGNLMTVCHDCPDDMRSRHRLCPGCSARLQYTGSKLEELRELFRWEMDTDERFSDGVLVEECDAPSHPLRIGGVSHLITGGLIVARPTRFRDRTEIVARMDAATLLFGERGADPQWEERRQLELANLVRRTGKHVP